VSHSLRAQPLVAIFDSTDEVIEMLARLLEEHGCQTVIGRIEEIQSGVLDLVAFLEEHDPHVILFDLPRPYERHLNFLRLLSTTDSLKRRGWVLMTTHEEALKVAFGSVDGPPSILGKPYVPTAVLQAVHAAFERSALGRNP
jgi:DNA-binding NarL/FixJ family response regulator